MPELYRLACSDKEAGYTHWRSDDETLVTFNTISYQLREARRSARTQPEENARDRNNEGESSVEPVTGDGVERHAWQSLGVKVPGVHTISNPTNRPEYVIVVPGDSLRPAVCRHWITRLNDQYDRELELMW